MDNNLIKRILVEELQVWVPKEDRATAEGGTPKASGRLRGRITILGVTPDLWVHYRGADGTVGILALRDLLQEGRCLGGAFVLKDGRRIPPDHDAAFQNPKAPWSYEGPFSVQFSQQVAHCKFLLDDYGRVVQGVRFVQSGKVTSDDSWGVDLHVASGCHVLSHIVCVRDGNGKLLWVNPGLREELLDQSEKQAEG